RGVSRNTQPPATAAVRRRQPLDRQQRGAREREPEDGALAPAPARLSPRRGEQEPLVSFPRSRRRPPRAEAPRAAGPPPRGGPDQEERRRDPQRRRSSPGLVRRMGRGRAGAVSPAPTARTRNDVRRALGRGPIRDGRRSRARLHRSRALARERPSG